MRNERRLIAIGFEDNAVGVQGRICTMVWELGGPDKIEVQRLWTSTHHFIDAVQSMKPEQRECVLLAMQALQGLGALHTQLVPILKRGDLIPPGAQMHKSTYQMHIQPRHRLTKQTNTGLKNS